jgi:hypothetical protein
MKQFMVFAGDNYYPCGGFDDFGGDFDLLSEAIAKAASYKKDWWHIVDTHALTICYHSNM